MKKRLATILLLVGALVVATFSASTTTPKAKADAPWPVRGCPEDATKPPPCNNDDVVLRWDEQLLATIRANPAGTGPTITARALGVLHTATYDAWEAYNPTAKSTQPNGIPEPQPTSDLATKSKAISYAAYKTLTDLFPYRRSVYAAQMTGLGYDPNDNSTNTLTPQGVGNVAAQAVINFRHNDGSNQTRNDNGTPGNPDDDFNTYPDPCTTNCYQPTRQWNQPTDPWKWQPLCVRTAAGVSAGVPPEPADGNCVAPNYGVQKPLTPQWPKVKTFAASPVQYKVTGPPRKPDGTCCSDADVVTALNDTSNLDDYKKVLSEYWIDGPGSEFPPGHTAVFAQALARKNNFSLDKNVQMFFALGNAELDASVGSWTTKYKYDFWRPIKAIRYVYRGQMINSWLGPGHNPSYGLVPAEQWQPYQPLTVVTPAFPEYVSGHSTFSAAGSIILQSYTTSDIFNAYVTISARNPDGSYWSKIEPGVPASPVTLSWPTFTAAADQAGISRRYGGIHFYSGDYHARMLGNLLGRGAYGKAKAYIQGTIGN